jgi:hypothetical protein
MAFATSYSLLVNSKITNLSEKVKREIFSPKHRQNIESKVEIGWTFTLKYDKIVSTYNEEG